MKKAYILSAVRTPIGKFGGTFTSIPATVLGGGLPFGERCSERALILPACSR